jgi:hypothetical protein
MTAQELADFQEHYEIPSWLLAAALDPPINERQIRYWRSGAKRIPTLRSDQFDELKRDIEAGNNPFAGIITRDDADWDPEDAPPISGKSLAIGLGIVGSLVIGGLYLLTGRGSASIGSS